MQMLILKVARLHDQVVWVNLVGLAQKSHSAAISWQGMLRREPRK
jgi:hypothetical protein